MASVDLRHILLDVLPSPAMMVQGRELRIQNHLAMICDHLWAINAVIMDAEIRALKEQDIEDWMADVGAAIDDLQVLLDGILDWAQARVVATASNPLFRHAIVLKLKKMARRLNDLMILGGSTLNLRKEMMDAMDPRREEYFTILKDEVVGRDDDRDKVIDFLQHQRYNSDGVPIFIAIRGKNEMGKTTLARTIFHHPWVRQHFHHCIWVDVSNHLYSLDFVSIARECVESITGEPSGHLQHPYLQLQEALGASRYFLVLNNFNLLFSDIETKLKHEWDQFRHILLHVGGPGSTVIIVTTRDYGEDILGPKEEAVVKSFVLGGLSEDDWVKLFMRHASFIVQPDHPLLDKEQASSPTPSIQDIDLLPILAKQLFHSCDGKPLAAKVLGSVLVWYTKVSRWQQLVHTHNDVDDIVAAKLLGSILIWYTEVSQWQQLVHTPKDIGDSVAAKLLGLILKRDTDAWQQLARTHNGIDLQYAALLILHHLPSGYDRLYLHASLFPEIPYDTEDFVHMMIVEGLIPHSYDKNLIERILPKPFPYVRWHRRLRSQYYFTMRVGQDSQIPRQCHHLCLLFNSTDSNASTFPTGLSAGAQKKLRTLVLHRMMEKKTVSKVQKSQIAKIPKAMFANLLNLRILNLGDSTIQELPSTVGKLLHLRYLNLSHIDIKKLPSSFCNLGNLQILNLSHCEKLKTLPRQIHKLRKLQIVKLAYCEKLRMLPESITALTNLQELDLEGCHRLDQLPEDFGNMKRLTELNMHKCVYLTRMPRGIGQLISLRKLMGFVVHDDLGSAPQQELQMLVNLEVLRLRGLERVSSSGVIRNIKLQEKPKLKKLALHWKWWNMDDHGQAILINSQQQILEDLQPNSVLEELEMVSYPDQKLPSWMTERELYVISLVEIRLINIKRCERLPSLGQLPHLEIVEISGMDSISVVDDAFYGDRDDTFLSLKELTFSEMPALEKWTMGKREDYKMLFPSLMKLTLIQCPRLRACEVWFGWISYLCIWLNNNEMLLTSNFMGWHNLSRHGVGKLEISGCEELRCLPQSMQNLGVIHHLTIIGCGKLISLPDWLKEWKRLRSLSISNCPKLSYIPKGLKIQLRSKLHVEGCPMLRR